MMNNRLQILFFDNHFIAVDKPPGMLLHRSDLARHEKRFVLQTLRDQIGRRVFPVHRLDRATSGVLMFALSPDAGRQLSKQFQTGAVAKTYQAVTRGWLDSAGIIEHPVRDRDAGGAPKPAITRYRSLARIVLPISVDRYPASRYTLAEVFPLSGRRHQIRQHFKHISHHLIGDTTYGNGKHNRFFRERLAIPNLLLRATSLAFTHPYSGVSLRVCAGMPDHWRMARNLFMRDDERSI